MIECEPDDEIHIDENIGTKFYTRVYVNGITIQIQNCVKVLLEVITNNIRYNNSIIIYFIILEWIFKDQ
jgi:hypothetical protein